jgi:hypothetical protein
MSKRWEKMGNFKDKSWGSYDCENSKLTIGFDANKERDVKCEVRETVA